MTARQLGSHAALVLAGAAPAAALAVPFSLMTNCTALSPEQVSELNGADAPWRLAMAAALCATLVISGGLAMIPTWIWRNPASSGRDWLRWSLAWAATWLCGWTCCLVAARVSIGAESFRGPGPLAQAIMLSSGPLLGCELLVGTPWLFWSGVRRPPRSVSPVVFAAWCVAAGSAGFGLIGLLLTRADAEGLGHLGPAPDILLLAPYWCLGAGAATWAAAAARRGPHTQSDNAGQTGV